MAETERLKVALAQMAPVWLERERTLWKMAAWAQRAADADAQLCVFGEALLPGYPFWVELSDGARFDDPFQKELYAHYLDQGVDPASDLAPLQELARDAGMAIALGCIERAVDRGGHSLYCSMIYIDARGEMQPVHRKLVPTHEERLVWAPGDGHGLRCHALAPFTLGGLLCWENWMTLPRAALHAQGEDLHLALWPGNERNTAECTRYLAREGRSFVLSVSGLMRAEDLPEELEFAERLRPLLPAMSANGGSCIAGPDGQWLVAPVVGEEKLILAELDHACVRRERQNFDPAGHYSRPDVLQLQLDRSRQCSLLISADDED